MQLVAFSATNYRSITHAYKLPLSNYVVLVGPNNEGKSNLLRAMVVSLRLLTEGEFYRPTRRSGRYRYRTRERFDYVWERDYPVNLFQKEPNGHSEFVLEFKLSSADYEAFRISVGSNLATNLKIKLSLGPRDAKFEVLIKGKGKKLLTEHMQQIAAFVRERIVVQYIPSLRPADLAMDVVQDILLRELSNLEDDPNYKDLVARLTAAQEPVLRHIGEELTATVSSFVPDINRIWLSNPEASVASLTGSFKLYVDDGTPTELDLKGDGVKSLTAISLLRHAAQHSLGDKSLILAIEEPESHLHSGAIHRLREVLQEIASSQQVIITTHSPLLVDRLTPSNNVLVQGGRATPAKVLDAVRQSLGVRLSDNLSGAHLVLLVEGEEDKRILEAWLPNISNLIGEAVNKRLFAIDHLGGASNLVYKAGLYRTAACNVYVFLDNDQDGRAAIARAEDAGMLRQCEYCLAVCEGMPNSEIEDLITLDTYSPAVHSSFGVLLDCGPMKTSDRKWSDRARICFEKQGKPWSDKIKMDLKGAVSQVAAAAGTSSLKPSQKTVIESLAREIEQFLLPLLPPTKSRGVVPQAPPSQG